MLQIDTANITNCIVHHVGNAYANESSLFSNKEIDIDDLVKIALKKLLSKNFKQPLTANQFVHSVDIQQNVVYKIAESIFAQTTDFKIASINLVKYLFEQSTHFAIKAGEVFVYKLENVNYNGNVSDAIAIFKIESNTKFLQTNYAQDIFELNLHEGIIGKNVEKACLIFNYDFDEGFNVFSFEKNATEAQYWNKDFLNIQKASNDYNATALLLNSFKEFVQHDIGEMGYSQKDKINMFNHSIEQLATQEASLYIADFIEENLPDTAAQNKYLSFLDDYKQANNFSMSDTINISKDAIQYHSAKNKSVIKLDKNFHIYVHGDASNIESGVDENGRKFYKLYFEEEH